MPLQCVTKNVEKSHRCSQCSQAVSTTDPRYLECLATLENLFPKYSAPDSTPEHAEMSSLETNQTISVVMLGGDSTVVEYKPSMTVHYLKSFVQIRLGPAPQKQRLLYKEQELKVRMKLSALRSFVKTRVEGNISRCEGRGSRVELIKVKKNIQKEIHTLMALYG